MAEVRGSRLKVWNTKPISWLRMAASSSSVIRATSLPFRMYEPAVGVSRQPIRFMRVDLPEPEGPMIPTYSPRSTPSVQPESAWTFSSPIS